MFQRDFQFWIWLAQLPLHLDVLLVYRSHWKTLVEMLKRRRTVTQTSLKNLENLLPLHLAALENAAILLRKGTKTALSTSVTIKIVIAELSLVIEVGLDHEIVAEIETRTVITGVCHLVSSCELHQAVYMLCVVSNYIQD